MIDFFEYNTTPIPVDEIANLFKDSFNQEMNSSYWEWRFLNNPVSKDVFIVYAKENGVLAAYYAVSPVAIVDLNGGSHTIALSNMTMTHPNYQGKGLFKALANKMFDLLKSKGFIGVYGFANSNSHYGFRNSLGWKDISALNLFCLKNEDVKSTWFKNNLGLTFEIDEMINADLRITENFCRVQNKISAVFNSQVYQWRFIQIPNKTYKFIQAYTKNEVIGHLVFKEFGTQIDVMEYWYLENPEIDKDNLLIHIINRLNSTYSGGINFWSNLHSSEHLILEKFGFKETEFNSYFGFIPFTDQPEFTQLENWHYRFTDSDIF